MHRIRSTAVRVGILVLMVMTVAALSSSSVAWAATPDGGAENGNENWSNPVVPPKGLAQAFHRDYQLMVKTVELQERKRPKDWEKVERITQRRIALQSALNERLKAEGYPSFTGEYFCEKGLLLPHEELPALREAHPEPCSGGVG